MYAALQKAHARKHPGSGAMPEVRKSAKTKTVGPGRVLPRR
jgi:hypothetical protein